MNLSPKYCAKSLSVSTFFSSIKKFADSDLAQKFHTFGKKPPLQFDFKEKRKKFSTQYLVRNAKVYGL